MRKLKFITRLMILLFTLTGLNSCTPDIKISAEQEKSFILAANNGELVNEALTRSKRYVDAWMPLTTEISTSCKPDYLIDTIFETVLNYE